MFCCGTFEILNRSSFGIIDTSILVFHLLSKSFCHLHMMIYLWCTLHLPNISTVNLLSGTCMFSDSSFCWSYMKEILLETISLILFVHHKIWTNWKLVILELPTVQFSTSCKKMAMRPCKTLDNKSIVKQTPTNKNLFIQIPNVCLKLSASTIWSFFPLRKN